MDAVLEVTDATFADEVLGADRPVIVDFWAPWCGPCRAVAPIVKELATDYADRVRVAKLNVDESPLTASRFSVLSIPTLILFADGEAQATVVGARPREHLERSFARWLEHAGV